MRINDFLFVIKKAPVPVTVFCEVGVRVLPYSSGKRYCLSQEQKCEDAMAIEFETKPFSINELPQIIASIAVEHAPYGPMNGTFEAEIAKLVDVH